LFGGGTNIEWGEYNIGRGVIKIIIIKGGEKNKGGGKKSTPTKHSPCYAMMDNTEDRSFVSNTQKVILWSKEKSIRG